MAGDLSLDEFWNSVAPSRQTFHAEQLATLAPAARKYLEHAIRPGAPLAAAVRLRMHGEIKLGRWLRFTAGQVIAPEQGMIWNATIRINGMPIRGFDRLIDGQGAMRWKLFGIPVKTASGADITRSTAGRVMAELVWLPSVLCRDEVSWTAEGAFQPLARVSLAGESADLRLRIDDDGRPKTLSIRRWANLGGPDFGYFDFGGIVEEERTFGDYMVPSRLRIGWYFGTDRFERDGEFFRVTVDQAEYR